MNENEIHSTAGVLLDRVTEEASSAPAVETSSDAGDASGTTPEALPRTPASDLPSGSAAKDGSVLGAAACAAEPEPSSTLADDPAAQQPAQDPATPADEPAIRYHYYANGGAVQFLLADGFVGGRLDRMKLSRLDGSAWRLTIETEVDSTCRTPAGHPFVADAVLHGNATDARRMALAMLRSHLAAVAKKHRHNAHRRARATAARKGGGVFLTPPEILANPPFDGGGVN